MGLPPLGSLVALSLLLEMMIRNVDNESQQWDSMCPCPWDYSPGLFIPRLTFLVEAVLYSGPAIYSPHTICILLGPGSHPRGAGAWHVYPDDNTRGRIHYFAAEGDNLIKGLSSVVRTYLYGQDFL